jgi:hypothetical protein
VLLGVWFIKALITQKNLLPVAVTFFVSWVVLAAIELTSIPPTEKGGELTPGELVGTTLLIAVIVGGPMVIKLLRTKIKNS